MTVLFIAIFIHFFLFAELPTLYSCSIQVCEELSLSPFRSNVEIAEELIEWKMYEVAQSNYEKALVDIEEGNLSQRQKITLRLAMLYLLQKKPQNTVELLEKTFTHLLDGKRTLFTFSVKNFGQARDVSCRRTRRTNSGNPIGEERNTADGTSQPSENLPGKVNKAGKSDIDEEALLLLSYAYIQLDQPEKVFSLIDPSTERNKLFLSMAHNAAGQNEMAKELLTTLCSNPSCDTLSKLHLLKTLLLTGSYREAIDLAKAICEDLTNQQEFYSEVLWLKAVAESHLEDYSSCYETMKIAIEQPYNSSNWYSSALIAISNAPQSQQSESSLENREFLEKVASLLTSEFKKNREERLALATVKSLVQVGVSNNNESYLEIARTILEDKELFKEPSLEMEALLLRAQAAKSYVERESHLKELTNCEQRRDELIAYGWYLRGNNEKEGGYSHKNEISIEEKKHHLEMAKLYYRNCYSILRPIDPLSATEALKAWAQIAYDNKEISELKEIYTLALSNPSSQATDNLKGLLAAHLYILTAEEQYIEDAISHLFTSSNRKNEPHHPSINTTFSDNTTFSEKNRLLIGKLLYLKKSFGKAEELLAATSTNTPLAAEALYWSGRAALKNPHPQKPAAEYFKLLSENYPKSPYAKEARFRIYTPQQYLHGDREAKKHLEEFLATEKESPYVIDAAFLLALDTKRDRKNSSGRWMSKGSMTKAIDLFQEVKESYERLTKKNLIHDRDKEHYSSLVLRASCEQAICNLLIAKESSGAKKDIFLQYTEELFEKLLEEPLLRTPPNYNLYDEAIYSAGRCYLESGKDEKAKEIFTRIVKEKNEEKISCGYYLSRALYHLASLSINHNDYEKALTYLSQAEESANGAFLSTDQTIDLWLQMSHCHKMMGEYDEAMKLLTRAIDKDAISSLRLKAMYMRAEIYQLQGRMDLCRRQLEATSVKGGEWAKKAKERLYELSRY